MMHDNTNIQMQTILLSSSKQFPASGGTRVDFTQCTQTHTAT